MIKVAKDLFEYKMAFFNKAQQAIPKHLLGVVVDGAKQVFEKGVDIVVEKVVEKVVEAGLKIDL